MTTSNVYLSHQYRTPSHIYVFKSKQELGEESPSLRLKIYDTSFKCLSKLSCNVPQAKLQALFSEPRAEKLFEYFPEESAKIKAEVEARSSSSKEYSLLSEPLELLNTLIKDFERYYSDPTTPILQLGGCVTEDANRRDQLMEEALWALRMGDSQGALSTCAKALLCTKQWRDYEQVIDIYERAGQPLQAQMARLYTAQYQCKAGAFDSAVDTLRTALDFSVPGQATHDDVRVPVINNMIRFLLAHCYAKQGKHEEGVLQAWCVIDFWKSAYEGKVPQTCYSYVKNYGSNAVHLPYEDPYVALQGACIAIEAGEMSKAEILCQQVFETGEKRSWLDQSVRIEMVARQNKNAASPKRLEYNLRALIREEKEDPQKVTKLYRLLSQFVDLRYDDCVAVFQARLQHKEKKVIPWAQKEIDRKLKQDTRRGFDQARMIYGVACAILASKIGIGSLTYIKKT